MPSHLPRNALGIGTYLVLVFLLSLFCTYTFAESDSAVEAEKKRREALVLQIKCVQVEGNSQTDLPDSDDAGKQRLQHLAARLARAKAHLADCGVARTDETPTVLLTGSGMVTVFVSKDSFASATATAKLGANQIRLYLNGFDQGLDAPLVSQEPRGKDLVALKFRVRQGDENKRMWTALYQSNGITAEVPLRIGLGWSSVGLVGQAPDNVQDIYGLRIAGGLSLLVAWGCVAVLFVGAGWMLFRTDTFRDAPTPGFWSDAVSMRRELVVAGLLNRRAGSGPHLTVAMLRAKVFGATSYGSSYASDQAAEARYLKAAVLALKGGNIAEESMADAVIGLAIATQRWKVPRATYSLGRVQVGVWFLFAVATGVLLRVVYGQLPVLPGSMLALITVSAATAVASYSVDVNAGPRPYVISTGLFTDLVTSFDDKQQLHRFQALVVNLLLLGVGAIQVAQELAYPTFDATWLAFLGVSGAALAVGKQMTEGAGVVDPNKVAADDANKKNANASLPVTKPADIVAKRKID